MKMAMGEGKKRGGRWGVGANRPNGRGGAQRYVTTRRGALSITPMPRHVSMMLMRRAQTRALSAHDMLLINGL